MTNRYSRYNDPIRLAEQRWQRVLDEIPEADRLALMAEQGVTKDRILAEPGAGNALLDAWRSGVVRKVRASYGTVRNTGLSDTVVRLLERVLELGFSHGVQLRLHPGLKRRHVWGCLLVSRRGIFYGRAWRVAMNQPHEFAFVAARHSGYELSWDGRGFTDDVANDAACIRDRHPEMCRLSVGHDWRYAYWLIDALDHARKGAIPCFFWPGHDGSMLESVPLYRDGRWCDARLGLPKG